MELWFNKAKGAASASSDKKEIKGKVFFRRSKNSKSPIAENYKYKQAFQKEVDRAKVF